MSTIKPCRVSARSFESLESRRLLAVTYGVNAVLNGGAETFAGTANGTNIVLPANWTANASPTIDVWTNPAYFSAALPKPPNTGNVLFVGGPDQSESDFFQTVDISNIGADIDAGNVSFTLSALLGGSGSQTDNASMFVNFQTSDHFFAGQSFVGPVSAADRNNNNGLVARTKTEVVPFGARFAQVQLHFERVTGAYNDGYADNASLIFNNTAVPVATSVSFNVNAHTAAFSFDRAINAATVTANDLQITNLATNVTANTATGVSLSADLKTVTFVVPTTLADANYRMRLPAGSVASAAGAATAANVDLNTFILAGDANRDRTVNFADLLITAQNYGKTGQSFTQGNFNYSADGLVGFDDLLLLSQRYGTSLFGSVPVAGSARSRQSPWQDISAPV